MGIKDIILSQKDIVVCLSVCLACHNTTIDLLGVNNEKIVGNELLEISINTEEVLDEEIAIAMKEIDKAESKLKTVSLINSSHIIFSVKLYRKSTLEKISQIDLKIHRCWICHWYKME